MLLFEWVEQQVKSYVKRKQTNDTEHGALSSRNCRSGQEAVYVCPVRKWVMIFDNIYFCWTTPIHCTVWEGADFD